MVNLLIKLDNMLIIDIGSYISKVGRFNKFYTGKEIIFRLYMFLYISNNYNFISYIYLVLDKNLQKFT